MFRPVNWALLAGCMLLVAGFRSSDAMASAYGIAVSMTMLISTVLIAFAMRALWRWPLPLVGLFLAVYGTIDLLFVSANMLKVADGGWVPLVLGASPSSLLMAVWTRRHPGAPAPRSHGRAA